MKVLIDQNLPPGIAKILRDRGIDAVHAEECGLRTASDSEILARCVVESRVIVTRDADFHALLAAEGATSPSVVRLRVERAKEVALTELLSRVLLDLHDQLVRGVAASVDEASIRVHDLPLKRRPS